LGTAHARSRRAERQEATKSKKPSHRPTDEERAERRRQDRERLQQAARELLSSDGWARWVKTRAMFHSYSAGNCMLLAAQCHERGIVPTRIAGFRTWLKLGRAVRKGETALRILAKRALSHLMRAATLAASVVPGGPPSRASVS
jgi:N-terminal domain of anti-restriction factor ArdC